MGEDKYDITLYVDGGSRGNPGPAAIGAVIERDGADAGHISECIGEATNNEAEYRALIEALKFVETIGAKSVHVKTDSLLMAKQLLGSFKVKSPNIRPLHDAARQMLGFYARVGIQHIPREENTAADELVNQALDAAAGKKPKKKKGGDSACPKLPGPAPIVSFLSDFGLADAWVGVVKGVIQSECPGAMVIDVSHEITPYDTMKGAFVLETAVEHIPAAAHLAVVDPDVGGARRAVMLLTARGDYLVGPDNGLLAPAAARLGGVESAYEIDEAKFKAAGSRTFHARDIFAPAAAKLAAGQSPETFGVEIAAESLAEAPYGGAKIDGKKISGQVVDVDRYGTLRLNVRRDESLAAGYKEGAQARVKIADSVHELTVYGTFSDVKKGEPLLVYDSSEYLCVSVNGAHAGLALGAQAGDPVSLELKG